MSRALRVELEALEELQEAAAWYEDKRPGLGVELVEAIDRARGGGARLPRFGRPGKARPRAISRAAPRVSGW
jgi:hypothetical protein